MIIQFIVSLFATLSFAELFGAPKKELFFCGLTGAIGWVVYVIGLNSNMGTVLANLTGAEGMCLGPQDMDAITMIYDSLAEQQDDGNSIYWYVKEALRLRNAYPEISHGTAEFLENLSDDAVCVLRKNWQDSSVIVVFNCTKDERTVDLSQISADSESGDLKLAGELLTGTRAASWQDGTLTLPAYGVAILK